ncbi:alpha/beta fold hydrolase [Sphingomonas sp. URHD0057]|uniref:alpha/beta fold hydrolase n=1 Tax=Sphingomonas sp. URHD0057 TaxID=1380389 RepID=UPI000561B54F|nr:alpha/beta hydrolase [Sphingomonas sp. URHD0057]
MVPVERGVQLEVLDFGGAGTPLIFLSGFGGTAHDFAGLAEKFTSAHHVYAITRRGFGKSAHPPATIAAYSPERLAADTLTVVKALRIGRPFLAGHSVAGQELSEIGTRHPERVRGLIYLDAANAEAFYGPSSNVLYPIAGEVRRDLEQLISAQPSEAPKLIEKITGELPRLQRGLNWYATAVKGVRDLPLEDINSRQKTLQDAIVKGARVYGPTGTPVLSIVALPLQCAPECDSEAAKRRELAAEAQAADFSEANPSAKVVRLPYADHFVWESNQKAVVDAMKEFMENAPR